MVVIRPGDHVWLTTQGEKKREVAIGAQIKKSEQVNLIYIMIINLLSLPKHFIKMKIHAICGFNLNKQIIFLEFLFKTNN